MNTLFTNLGFNLGNIYTDVVNILIYYKNKDNLFTKEVSSYRLGHAVGDLLMRPFYRQDFSLTFQYREEDLPLPCEIGECTIV